MHENWKDFLVTLHEVPEGTADHIKIGACATYTSKTTQCLTVIYNGNVFDFIYGFKNFKLNHLNRLVNFNKIQRAKIESKFIVWLIVWPKISMLDCKPYQRFFYSFGQVKNLQN